MEIDEILRYMRMIKKLSAKSVAEQIGCAPNTLANWEKGKVSPPVDSAFKLCKVYGISPNQLFGCDPIPEIDDFKAKNEDILTQIGLLEQSKSRTDAIIREYLKKLSQG